MVSIEAKSVSEEQMDAWKSGMLPVLIREYEPKDIFNAVECGLFYNLLLVNVDMGAREDSRR
jgi:hypothetical protein